MSFSFLKIIKKLSEESDRIDFKVLAEALRKDTLELDLNEEEQDARNILEELKIDDDVKEKIVKLLDKLKDENLDALVKRLNELGSDEIEFLLIDFEKDELIKRLPINGAIKAELSAEVQVNSLPDLVVIPTDQDQVILRLGVDGEASVNGAVAGKAGVTSLKVNSGFTSGVELDYYFRQPGDDLLAESLKNSLPELERPLGLPDVDQPIQEPLRLIRLSANGTASFGGEVNIGKGVSRTFNQGSSTPINAEFNITGGLKFASTVSGTFLLLRELNNDGTYSVTLKRTSKNASENTISVGASAGITGVKEAVEPVLNRYLPEVKSLITKLEEFKDVKGLIVSRVIEKVKDILNDENLKAIITKAFTGEVKDEDIKGFIEQEAEEYLDEKYIELTAKGKPVADSIAEAFIKILDKAVPGLVDDDKIRKKVFEGFEEGAEEAREALTDFIKKQVDEHADELTTILNALGLDAAKLITQAQETINVVLLPILDIIKKYATYREQIFKVVKASANLKLSLSMARKRERTLEEDINLRFVIDPSQENAASLYRAMTVGRFEKAMQAAFNADDQTIMIDPSSTFRTRDFARKSFDLNFVGLGVSLGMKNWSSVDFESSVNLNGDILIGIKGQTGHLSKMLGETRTGSFFSDISLAGALTKNTGQSGQNKLLNFGVSLSYSDEHLKEGEIVAYLQPLLDMALIRKEAQNEFIARFRHLRSPDKATKAEIGLTFLLEEAQLNTLINAAKSDMYLEVTFLRNYFDYLFNHRPTKAKRVPPKFGRNLGDDDLISPIAQEVAQKTESYWTKKRHGGDLSDTQIAMGKTLACNLKDGVRKVAEMLTLPANTSKDYIRNLQEDINDDFKPFTIVEGDLFERIFTGGKTGIRWRNVVFFKTIIELTAPGDYIPIVVQWHNANEDQTIFI